MNLQRNFLIIALMFVSFMIWYTWKQDKNFQSQSQITQAMTISTGNIPTNHNLLSDDHGKQITIKTDVLEININTRGGDIDKALLLAYPKELKSKEAFKLLETTSEFVYQAQSGLTGCDGPDNPVNGARPLYNVDKDSFTLADDQNEISMSMNYTDAFGNIFIKTFTLRRNEYVVNISYKIQNTGTKPLEVLLFGQLKQSINIPSHYYTESSNFDLHTFRGAVYSTSTSKYEKYSFDTIANNKKLNITSKGGWIAMSQQYFATAWIPNKDSTNNFYTTSIGNDFAIIGYKSQPVIVQPGQISTLFCSLWIGPKIQDKMAAVAAYLDLTVDYGWLWFISQPLFKLLKFIHGFFDNWGLSVIITTFIVRGIIYPLTKAQYTAMVKIRTLQPKIQAIRGRLYDDKQRQNQEIIALYKAERVNPLSGCFPLLIQMPIFLALYYMLMSSVELRHAPFVLWIQDLSAQDPYYILPILMGVTMFFIQKTSPTTVTDPIQQKIMTFITVVFTVFFLWFPSGLVLYYIVNNLMTIIQQWLIYRGLENSNLYNHKKKKS